MSRPVLPPGTTSASLARLPPRFAGKASRGGSIALGQ